MWQWVKNDRFDVSFDIKDTKIKPRDGLSKVTAPDRMEYKR